MYSYFTLIQEMLKYIDKYTLGKIQNGEKKGEDKMRLGR